MTARNKATLKGYFNTGDIPTETQFGDLIDSLGPNDGDHGNSFVPLNIEHATLSGTGWTNDATGPCGLTCYHADAYFKNIQITDRSGTVLYTCDLSAVADGDLPADWTVISGTWAVATVGGEKVLEQSDVSASFMLIQYDGWDAAWETSGAVLTCQVKQVHAGGEIVGHAVYIKAAPNYDRYYWFANMSAGEKNLRLRKIAGGVTSNINIEGWKGYLTMNENTWYWLKTAVLGALISCWFGETSTDLLHWYDHSWGSTCVAAEDYGIGVMRGLWWTSNGVVPTFKIYVDDPVTPIYNGPASTFFFSPYASTTFFGTDRLGKHAVEGFYIFQDIPYTTYFRLEFISTEITDRLFYAQAFCERLSVAISGKRAVFHVTRTTKAPADAKFQLLVDADGEGVLDTVFLSGSNSAGSFIDAESNMYVFRDNAYNPALQSSGTEDFFLNSWYWGKVLNTDVAGITHKDAGTPALWYAYRRFIYDPFYFSTHIKIMWTLSEGTTLANLSFDAVVFYYTST